MNEGKKRQPFCQRRQNGIWRHSMDDDEKKQINDVICIVKDICDEHFSECMGCPLYKHICNGLGGLERQPYLWKLLD